MVGVKHCKKHRLTILCLCFMLCAIITAVVVNKALLFVANDHPFPKSPCSEKRRQKLNVGYSCKRCRYDLKKKTFSNARKHQFQTLSLKFAEIIKPSNFTFQKPFYRANSTSFQSFRFLVSLSFKSEVNAVVSFFFHQDGIFTELPVLSPHVREYGFRNKRNLNPESWALESRIQLKKSGIPLTIGFY